METENQSIREKEELKSNLEANQRQTISKLTKDKDEQIHGLRKELEEITNNVTHLKQSHIEEILLLEQSKQKSVVIAQQEQKSLNERLDESMTDLEDIKLELEKTKRENGSRLEKDRASIAELQIEISKLQSLLEERSKEFEGEKSVIDGNFTKEKQDRIAAENEVSLLKSTLKITNDKVAQLNNELLETKTQLDETNDSKKQTMINLHEIEKKLEESKLQNDRLDQMKVNLNETVKDLEEEKASLEIDLRNAKSRSRHLEDQLHQAKQDVETFRKKCHLIENDNQEIEEQLSYWQSQHQELLNDHRELEVQLDNLKSQLVNEDEQKQAGNKETQNLRLKISELESCKLSLEKELSALRSTFDQDQEVARQRISTLNHTIDEIRTREKKLEDQRHTLEISLNHAQQEVKEINVKLHGYDGRLGELYATIAKLESEKKEVEMKLSSVASLLHHVRSSSNSRSRPPTPTRSSGRPTSSSNRRGSSPWPATSKSVMGEVDVDQVKGDIRELVERISMTMKERDEALHKVVTLKRQNDDMLENTVNLEDQISNQKKRSRGLEEQLKKCELKISQNDAHLATQVKEKRSQCLQYLYTKLDFMTDNSNWKVRRKKVYFWPFYFVLPIFNQH